MTAKELAQKSPIYRGLSDTDRALVDRQNEGLLRRESAKKPGACPICGGFRAVFTGPNTVMYCDCKAQHDNMCVLNASGLTEELKRMTFETFKTPNEWQAEIKRAAFRYARNPDGAWFYIGGQVGCGKTHLCSAIMSTLIAGGQRARYMVWPDEVDKIKGNAEGFVAALDRLMDTDVLYIDDFLKTPKEQRRIGDTIELVARAPTTGELNAAFKLINYRYNRGDKLTILSSEFFLDNIMQYDAGLGSRIYQRSKAYRFEIGNDENKNMRLHYM